ncbi:hypothetical protein HanRHA438_Chr17g0814761 [Helianthus annuus]|nr:hypothetical protein HanHA89_Chr17g0707991 [Helianthus annuus]KAJ0826480.1 hypothetical protein HanRHA438_Chr17g0814761 [Helianthus annuus]
MRKQTLFFLQTAEVWSTSSATEVCRCGPQTADILPLKKQTAPETSRRLTEAEEKLEGSETARATAESELEPLRSDMAWLKDRGIACVAESVLNSEELDKTVARLVVAA